MKRILIIFKIIILCFLIEKYIRNKGKGNALNIGINLSLGELICVLDADCVLDNEALLNIICHFDDENVMAAGARLEAMQKAKNC